jgi:hypothetical protein
MNIKILAITISSFLTLPVLQAAPPKPVAINPALLYWQAAAQLPKLSDEQAKELREIVQGKRPATPVKEEESSVSHILRAAATSTAQCDWGLMVEDGPAMVMPHLSKMREFANLAIVEGERALAQGKTAEGLEWFLHAHRMARHSGAGDTLISFLVQTSIETTALQAAARHCLGWDEPTRRDYAAKLQALPPLRTLQEGYHGELLFADWFQRLADNNETGKLQQMAAMFSVDASGASDQAKSAQKAVQALSVPDILRKELVTLRALHHRIETAFGKSWKDGLPEIEAVEAELKTTDSILAKLALPAFRSVHSTAFGLATRRTMLDMALQYVAKLDEATAATAHDSFAGAPLQLKKESDGSLRLVAAEEYPKGKVIDLKLGK